MKNTLKNILSVLDKKERQHFFVLVSLDVLVSVLDILFLALLLWIIQFYIQPGQTYKPFFLSAWLADRDSVLFIAVFVALFSIKNGLAYIISRSHYRFINKVAIRISYNNLLNYQYAGFGEFTNTDSSVHIRKICFRPFDFAQYMLSGIQQIITQLSLMLVAIIAILLFNAKLFLLLLLILLPPVVIVFWFVKKRLTAFKKNIQASNERSFQYVLDALKGYVEGNIYGRNDFFGQRFINARKIFSTHLFESLALQTLPGRIIEVFAVLGLFILIVIAKWTGNNDSAMLITIGAFMAAAYKIIPGIVKVINISGQMRAYEFSFDEADSYRLDKKEFQPAGMGTDNIHSIQLRNISFRFGSKSVFSNFSMTVTKGDFIGITGESGKGKTTLFNILLGFLSTASGDIFINNKICNADEIKVYWPGIAYVRQQGFFIHDTLIRNITLEEDDHSKVFLQNALDISGLTELIKQFPEGAGKMITENGKNISGGQQQRIAIARALYKNAPVILLDEPFNELDEEATQSLLEHFKRLAAEGKTILMITHDKKSLSFCNKIISFDA